MLATTSPRFLRISIASVGLAVGVVGLLVATPLPAGAAKVTKTTSYSVSCTEATGQVGTFSLMAKTKSVYPASVHSAAFFSAKTATTYSSPASISNIIYSAGGRYIGGTATLLNLYSSDAAPSPENVVGSGLTLTPVAIVQNQPLVIGGNKVPALWQANMKGTDTVRMGEMQVSLTLYDGTGSPLATDTVQCMAPTSHGKLFSVTVLP